MRARSSLLHFLIYFGSYHESDHQKFAVLGKPMHPESETGLHSVTQSSRLNPNSKSFVPKAIKDDTNYEAVVVGSALAPVYRPYYFLEGYMPCELVEFRSKSRPFSQDLHQQTASSTPDISHRRAEVASSPRSEYPPLRTAQNSENLGSTLNSRNSEASKEKNAGESRNSVIGAKSDPTSSSDDNKVPVELNNQDPSKKNQQPVLSQLTGYAAALRKAIEDKKKVESSLKTSNNVHVTKTPLSVITPNPKSIVHVKAGSSNRKTFSQPLSRMETVSQEWKTITNRKGSQRKLKKFEFSPQVPSDEHLRSLSPKEVLPQTELETVKGTTWNHKSDIEPTHPEANHVAQEDQDETSVAAHDYANHSPEKEVEHSQAYTSKEGEPTNLMDEAEDPKLQEVPAKTWQNIKQIESRKQKKKPKKKSISSKNNSERKIQQDDFNFEIDLKDYSVRTQDTGDANLIAKKQFPEGESKKEDEVDRSESTKHHSLETASDPAEMKVHEMFYRVLVKIAPNLRPDYMKRFNTLYTGKRAIGGILTKESQFFLKSLDLNLVVMHFLSSHLKVQNKTPHLGLEPINERLVDMLMNIHFQMPKSMQKTYRFLKNELGDYEASRRLTTLSRQIFQFYMDSIFQKEPLKKAKNYPGYIGRICTEVSKDKYGTKICRLDDIAQTYTSRLFPEETLEERDRLIELSSAKESRVQKTLQEGFGNLEYNKRMPVKNYFDFPEFKEILRASNYKNILNNEHLISGLESNGINLNRVLTVTFILGLENEDWLKTIGGNEIHYMGKILLKMLKMDDREAVLPWHESPDKYWLINHYKEEYSVKFHDFISTLKSLKIDIGKTHVTEKQIDLSLETLAMCLNRLGM